MVGEIKEMLRVAKRGSGSSWVAINKEEVESTREGTTWALTRSACDAWDHDATLSGEGGDG